MSTRNLVGAALTAAVLVAVGPRAIPGVEAQSKDAPIPHKVGQSVTPSFEGWYTNQDGTFSLAFGYMNRNYEQVLDIPIGPNNRIEPGPADQGQPTHFLPRRNTGVFTVEVPADFGDKQVTWTLVSAGETISIPGHLRPEWEITALEEVTSGNTPPVIKFDPAGKAGQGPQGVHASMQATRPDATVTAWVTDDGVRRIRRADNPPQLGVVWSKYRGPGTVTFSERAPEIGADGKVSTTATFSEPGEYMLRALAWDDSGSQGFIMAGGFFCCWTNGYMTVTVR